MNFFGNNLRHLRKEKGLTQQQLADKLGITRSLVGAYEENRAEPKNSGTRTRIGRKRGHGRASSRHGR